MQQLYPMYEMFLILKYVYFDGKNMAEIYTYVTRSDPLSQNKHKDSKSS